MYWHKSVVYIVINICVCRQRLPMPR